MKKKASVRRCMVWVGMVAFISSSAFALETELHGFVDTRFGMRTQNDSHESDRSLSEIRLQLENQQYFDWGEFMVRSDFLYDDLATDRNDIDLETGQGFMDLRELNLLFTPVDWSDVKVGRQILTWGTGDLLFINDLFPKDWNSFLLGRDEEYLKAPSDAAFISFFPEVASIDLVYTPRFDADRYIDGSRVSYWHPGYQEIVGQNAVMDAERNDEWFRDYEISSRIYRDIAGYETALYFYRGYWKSPMGVNPSTGNACFPRLNAYGLSTKGTLGKGLINFEGGYYESREDENGNDPYVANSEARFLAGYEREIGTDFTAGVQYYLEFMLDHDDYLAGVPNRDTARDEARHVVTLRLTKMLMNQNLILGLFIFYSPSDEDAYFRPVVTYKLTDAWTVAANANVFVGEHDYTFFGQFKDNSNINLALRYSF